MSDPPLSDIDFENKMDGVWTTLKDTILKKSGQILKNIYGSGRTLTQYLWESEYDSYYITHPCIVV